MKKIFEGVMRFKKDIYPQHKALFEKLASSQSPEVMMVTCADSRIEPAMMTQTGPGDLFVCRNAGNFVPAISDDTSGTVASIEFAVAALGVKDIIICGHTDCGAMKGCISPEAVAPLPEVAKWLTHGTAAVDAVRAEQSDLTGREMLNAVTRQNVIQQISNIKTHPVVAEGLSAGTLAVHGWVYDIGHGEILAYDEADGQFHAIAEMAPAAV